MQYAAVHLTMALFSLELATAVQGAPVSAVDDTTFGVSEGPEFKLSFEGITLEGASQNRKYIYFITKPDWDSREVPGKESLVETDSQGNSAGLSEAACGVTADGLPIYVCGEDVGKDGSGIVGVARSVVE
ncbi:hypothetical protein BJ508DRAFT_321936 [Ascobolus immersus RN42]|uniref:DNase1 protein n=1 Tax=Ascobolus immersus RN42 TaxID=1160509 RepID=A0A3N4IJE9_ASCIM|nr:hypothetical protein BJ508DRAFT_321936 [Ascobolus immersus RN42]